jgi:acetolactate synthase-1/2/3 large subunit
MKLGGIDHLFFVSGSELTFYQEAIAKAGARGWPAPKLVTMVHEQVALAAALGDSMVRNQPSAAVAHVDVGTLNFGASIHGAWVGAYPVMLMGGAGPRAFPGVMPGGRDDTVVKWVQEPRDQGEIVRQYTKLDHRMEHQDNPGLMVSRMLQVAMSEPRGPVYLAIPQETAMLPLDGKTNFPTVAQLGLAKPGWPDPADAKLVARWLIDSEKALIATLRAGNDPAAVPELIRLAELLAIPVAETSQSSRLNFPTTHPLYGTGPAASEADVLLVMEEIVPYIPGQTSPRPDTKIVWVSTDPVMSRLKTYEFRADLWITASVRNAARAIADAAELLLTPSDRMRIAARRAVLEKRRKQIDSRELDLAHADIRSGRLTGRVVAYELGKLLDPQAILLDDGLSNSAFLRHFGARTEPGTLFKCASSAGGWGPGAAFGAKLSQSNRDVVLGTGDGYFMFGSPLAALWAASYHKAPFLTVVFVNGTYGTGTVWLKRNHPDGVAVETNNYSGGTFDPPPSFGKLAEAANGHGEDVTTLDQLAPALRRGLEATRNGIAAVIAVRVPGPLG